MERADVAWLAFWVGFGLLDYAADRRGRSLCTSTRRVFHTDTPAGRAALDGSLAIGYLVLRRHLLRRR